jgi:hypothetical protein
LCSSQGALLNRSGGYLIWRLVDVGRPHYFFLLLVVSVRTILSLASLMVFGVIAGCDQPAPVPSTVPASSEHHGGILVPLTDKEAYVELVNGERKKNGSTFDTTIVAYVLQSDQKRALAETPTSVQAKVQTPKGEKVIAFKAAPDSADPIGSSRFESALGPFDLHHTGGEVTVQVGGKTLTGTFRSMR